MEQEDYDKPRQCPLCLGDDAKLVSAHFVTKYGETGTAEVVVCCRRCDVNVAVRTLTHERDRLEKIRARTRSMLESLKQMIDGLEDVLR